MPDRRFLIIGLPRSGTTYLMTMLAAHRGITCSGEQFNPHAIVGFQEKETAPQAIHDRDRAPLYFMRRFFEQAEAAGAERVGFKFMLGHNIRVLRALSEMPELTLIHVWRENRLAQVSSLIKAAQTRRWAQSRLDAHVDRKIKATPRQISHRWHEYATMDFLFTQWLETQPHRRITLEYRELFATGFPERICNFLGVEHDLDMRSPLVKQGANDILTRFEDPEPVARYFKMLNLAHWLDPEL